jgi:hypothetical protein
MALLPALHQFANGIQHLVALSPSSQERHVANNEFIRGATPYCCDMGGHHRHCGVNSTAKSMHHHGQAVAHKQGI